MSAGGSPIEHVRKGLEAIAARYDALGAAASFTSYVEDGAGHVLSAEMWRLALAFFWLHLVAEASRPAL